MLTELCQYLHNWFDRKPDGGKYPKYSGSFTVSDGVVQEMSGQLLDGQYYRILGSLFSDGVHKYGDESDMLPDETFEGVIWSMGVPPEIVALSADIDEWKSKYAGVDSAAMSPYNSESFGGYSYSKSAGGYSAENGASSGWQSVFGSRLSPWRKI